MADFRFATRDEFFIDVRGDIARIRKIEKCREKGDALDNIVTHAAQHGKRAGEQGATNTKPQRVDFFNIGDQPHVVNRFHDTVGDVVVPGQVPLLGFYVAP